MFDLMQEFKNKLVLQWYGRKKIETYCKYIWFFFLWTQWSLESFDELSFDEFVFLLKIKGKSKYTIKECKKIFRLFCDCILYK